MHNRKKPAHTRICSIYVMYINGQKAWPKHKKKSLLEGLIDKPNDNSLLRAMERLRTCCNEV